MISSEDVRQFLPTFLSQGSETAFLDEIRHFLDSRGKPFYTSNLTHPILFQGDGLDGLLVINLPDPTVNRAPALLFSNTCDINPANKRFFRSSLSYAPIFALDRYLDALRAEYSSERVDSHEQDIREQGITQIFFLPQGGKLQRDSLVFLDRTMSASSATIDPQQIPHIRLFTLSDFGAWLFALKLSIHFCRIRDKVDRTAGTIA